MHVPEPAQVLDRLSAERAGSLFRCAPEHVGDAVEKLFTEVGETLEAIRLGWATLDTPDSMHFILEWARDGHVSGKGSRYLRSELPTGFTVVDSGITIWATRSSPDSHPELRALLDDEQSDAILAAAGIVDGRATGLLSLEFQGHEPRCAPPNLAALQRLANLVAEALAHAETSEAGRTLSERLHRRQRLENLGVLAGGVAHDFNNMLQVIEVYGQMVRDALTDEQAAARELADEMLTASSRAADLTRRLLTFTREDARARKLVPLAAELDRIARLSRRLLPETIEVVTETTPAFAEAHCMCADFDQALFNLLKNAADATGSGTLRVAAEVVDRPDDDDDVASGAYARISVIDRGRGMSQEQLDRAFEPFFTTKAAGAGTGLGLAMVKGMVNQAGGRIDIESEPGTGTRVSLLLPLTAPGAVPESREVTDLRGDERVLVVEDNGLVRRVARTVLQQAGYTVLVAASARAALAALDTDGPAQLVISDVIMPDGGGRELLAGVRARDPDTPVLFCSGYTAGTLGDEVFQQPRCGFLAKPYQARELLIAVRRMLD